MEIEQIPVSVRSIYYSNYCHLQVTYLFFLFLLLYYKDEILNFK